MNASSPAADSNHAIYEHSAARGGTGCEMKKQYYTERLPSGSFLCTFFLVSCCRFFFEIFCFPWMESLFVSFSILSGAHFPLIFAASPASNKSTSVCLDCAILLPPRLSFPVCFSSLIHTPHVDKYLDVVLYVIYHIALVGICIRPGVFFCFRSFFFLWDRQ